VTDDERRRLLSTGRAVAGIEMGCSEAEVLSNLSTPVDILTTGGRTGGSIPGVQVVVGTAHCLHTTEQSCSCTRCIAAAADVPNTGVASADGKDTAVRVDTQNRNCSLVAGTEEAGLRIHDLRGYPPASRKGLDQGHARRSFRTVLTREPLQPTQRPQSLLVRQRRAPIQQRPVRGAHAL
jgi:hypothetical protein